MMPKLFLLSLLFLCPLAGEIKDRSYLEKRVEGDIRVVKHWLASSLELEKILLGEARGGAIADKLSNSFLKEHERLRHYIQMYPDDHLVVMYDERKLQEAEGAFSELDSRGLIYKDLWDLFCTNLFDAWIKEEALFDKMQVLIQSYALVLETSEEPLWKERVGRFASYIQRLLQLRSLAPTADEYEVYVNALHTEWNKKLQLIHPMIQAESAARLKDIDELSRVSQIAEYEHLESWFFDTNTFDELPEYRDQLFHESYRDRVSILLEWRKNLCLYFKRGFFTIICDKKVKEYLNLLATEENYPVQGEFLYYGNLCRITDALKEYVTQTYGEP